MLFVSLLQGFGLLPGKAASKSGVTAAGVDAHNAADSEMAVAEKTLSRSSKDRYNAKVAPSCRISQRAGRCIRTRKRFRKKPQETGSETNR
jgi:hypothetical protein